MALLFFAQGKGDNGFLLTDSFLFSRGLALGLKRQQKIAHRQYQAIHLNSLAPFNLDIATITFNLTLDALQYLVFCWINMFNINILRSATVSI